jgi:cysteinyl-tRNA synthetase
MKTISEVSVKSEIDPDNIRYIFKDVQYYYPIAFNTYRFSIAKRAKETLSIFKDVTDEDVKVKTFEGVYYNG